MEIKGEIGEEVLIKAKIVGGGIYGARVFYTVEIGKTFRQVEVEPESVIFNERVENIPTEKEEIECGLLESKPAKIKRDDQRTPNKADRPIEAKRIDALFLSKNMTVNDFVENFNTYASKKIGVSTFYAHKSGVHKINDDMLKAYADYFNVDVAYLKGEQDERRKFHQKRATVESTMAKLEKMKAREELLNE